MLWNDPQFFFRHQMKSSLEFLGESLDVLGFLFCFDF